MDVHQRPDNAFVRIDDWVRAQELADRLSPDQLHRTLDRYADQCCPVSDVFGQSYHWSLTQVEYATDLAFRSTATLGSLHEQLIRQSVLSVKAEQVASFLGRHITPRLAQEIGSQFSTRIEGTRVKHRFGKSSIKMYDKCGIVLRIETTTNDVSFFKHHRKVEHRNGPPTRELAPVKQSIYSLIDLREILLGCDRRYLAHLSALDDFSGVRALARLTRQRDVDGKTVKSINFFEPRDGALLHAPRNPRTNIAGVRRADLLPDLGMFSPGPGKFRARPAVGATPPIAKYRRHQAGHRDVSVLSDKGRTRGYRGGRTPHRSGDHSGFDLMGLLMEFYTRSGKSSAVRD